MTGKEYQELAMRTALTNGLEGDLDRALTVSALGLTGEAGEFADAIKKWLFHYHDLDRNHLIKELGDTMWYVARASEALGVTVDDVMEANINKLKHRYPDGFSSEASVNRES